MIQITTGSRLHFGLFHLPGVDSGNTKQTEERHDDRQQVDKGPRAGGDGRNNLRWMDQSYDRENTSGRHG